MKKIDIKYLVINLFIGVLFGFPLLSAGIATASENIVHSSGYEQNVRLSNITNHKNSNKVFGKGLGVQKDSHKKSASKPVLTSLSMAFSQYYETAHLYYLRHFRFDIENSRLSDLSTVRLTV